MMQNWAFGAFGKNRSKSKTPDNHHQQCLPFVGNMPQAFACQQQQNMHLQTHAYQPPQSAYNQHTPQHMQIPMATCQHQWQSNMIHSLSLQPVVYPIHEQMPNNATIEPRSGNQHHQPLHNMLLGNQVQQPEVSSTIPQANHQFQSIPTYQQNGNQAHFLTATSTQPSRYPENNFYSNQVPNMMQPHNQPQQHQLEHKIIPDEQQLRQSNLQPNLQQQSIHSIQRQTSQQEIELQRHRQLANQQQCQNNSVLSRDLNEDSDLSLQTLCLIYESENEELLKMAGDLKEDLMKLNQELELIRKQTPKYTVTKFMI